MQLGNNVKEVVSWACGENESKLPASYRTGVEQHAHYDL